MTPLADPERQLALSYAPTSARDRLHLLWQLDERMGAIVAAAREPAIGAMRLLWWRDALERLDDPAAAVPAEPLLAAIATSLLPAGLSGTALSGLEEGWAALLDDGEPDDEAIDRHGALRGGRLFQLSATLLGAAHVEVATGGEGWALAELGHRLSGAGARLFARTRARESLAGLSLHGWPASLGLLVTLAKRDAAMSSEEQRRQGSPSRVLRAIAYRLFGG